MIEISAILSEVFNSGQKMALKELYLSYGSSYYEEMLKRSQRHILFSFENS